MTTSSTCHAPMPCPKRTILIADDDPGIQAALRLLLQHRGYRAVAATTEETVIPALREHTPDAVLLDMNFTSSTTGEQGIALLRKIRILQPDTPVLLITAWASIELAVEGMRHGAFDFITKPWNNRQLLSSLETALSLRTRDARAAGRASAQTQSGRIQVDAPYIVGQSPALQRILQTVGRVASTEASVLILGESGTGKELIARAIHENSRRANGPMVRVNLGGIATALFESEMFGHKRGAFTDAYADRKGRVEMADGGTLFLDEIGELDLPAQVKLLRVLQEKSYEVLGDSTPRQANVRIVCATNADLSAMVASRAFREDLLYRINLITLTLPPLRERREDIRPLCLHFMEAFGRENGIPPAGLTDDALEMLLNYPFPGNVRELKNIVERAMLLQGEGAVNAEAMRSSIRQGQTATGMRPPDAGDTLEAQERAAIRRKMQEHNGNISHVAKSLGISRAALYRRLEKYGIPF